MIPSALIRWVILRKPISVGASTRHLFRHLYWCSARARVDAPQINDAARRDCRLLILHSPLWSDHHTQRPKAMTSRLSALVLLLLVASAPLLHAASAVKEFLDGTTKFSTAGHPKAKGLVMTIEYPSTWAAKESDYPNIVQGFVRPEGQVMAAIVINALPLPPGTKIPENELKEFFTPSKMKDVVPESATLLAAKPTKIQGLPAGVLEYSMRQESAGITVDMRVAAFVFIYNTTMVQLQCSVGAPGGQAASLEERMADFMPLFTLMANSIVLPAKWK